MSKPPIQITPEARYSQDKLHRYVMWQPTPLGGADIWAEKWGVFIGLNPLLTEEHPDNPYVRKLLGFALREGCGVCVILNLYSVRTGIHGDLRDMIGANGPANNSALAHYATRQGTTDESKKPLVVAAWGGVSDYREDGKARVEEVVRNLRRWGVFLQCFGLTKDNYPRHPLLLDATTKLEPYPSLLLHP